MAQLSREIQKQIRVKKVVNFKPFWFLSAMCGQHNNFDGEVYAYEPIYGTGGAVVSLTPSAGSFGDKEFDEDDVEVSRETAMYLVARRPPIRLSQTQQWVTTD